MFQNKYKAVAELLNVNIFTKGSFFSLIFQATPSTTDSSKKFSGLLPMKNKKSSTGKEKSTPVSQA
jgi:hypothetical protein